MLAALYMHVVTPLHYNSNNFIDQTVKEPSKIQNTVTEDVKNVPNQIRLKAQRIIPNSIRRNFLNRNPTET